MSEEVINMCEKSLGYFYATLMSTTYKMTYCGCTDKKHNNIKLSFIQFIGCVYPMELENSINMIEKLGLLIVYFRKSNKYTENLKLLSNIRSYLNRSKTNLPLLKKFMIPGTLQL